MNVILSACVLYLSVFAFQQAGARRTVFAGIKSSPEKQRLMRAAGWGLAAIALVILAQAHGAERGAPIWLASFMLSAFACLLIGALLPKRQTGLAVAVFAAALLISGFSFIGGVS